MSDSVAACSVFTTRSSAIFPNWPKSRDLADNAFPSASRRSTRRRPSDRSFPSSATRWLESTLSSMKSWSSTQIPPAEESHLGKGENLWKALHVSRGDMICYVDGDISNFHPGFITGLTGPLLTDPGIDYVKAFYERPLAYGDESHSTGGGRVSEILIRPLISLFYPELV